MVQEFIEIVDDAGAIRQNRLMCPGQSFAIAHHKDTKDTKKMRIGYLIFVPLGLAMLVSSLRGD